MKEQRMMGKHLQVTSDEPDLVPAVGNAGVLVHGDHVVVSAEVVGDAHYLPQLADLTTHRLLCGRPKEWPVKQSESITSSIHTDTQTDAPPCCVQGPSTHDYCSTTLMMTMSL